jgi:archaellum biogenesis protein FlaJ (TadC family)
MLEYFEEAILIIVNVFASVTIPAVDGSTKYSSFTGYAHLSAGLCCGLRYVIIDY